METVGVGISALALFIECLQAYKLFSAAHHLNDDLKTLETKFKIEETRLTQWGFYWGYRPSQTECSLDASLDSAGQNVALTVKLTLQQIATRLHSYDALSAKYSGKDGGSGPAHARRGMAWVLKDRAKLELTVRDLADFNNGLHQLLPRKSEASLAQVVACALTRGNDGSDLEGIIAAAASLQFADAEKLARFKRAYQKLAVEEEQEQVYYARALPSSLQLDASLVKLSDKHSCADRAFASFGGTELVMVEWRSYDPGMLSGSRTAQMTLRNRASHLAELLSRRTQRPEGFNILTCRGYFDQVSPERFGFVYELPPNVHPCAPFTLHQLFTQCKMPPLGTRFRLALSLSRTLNLLHTSGWLHKSVRSNNITIFQAADTKRPEFERPYLTGFDFSRPDGYDEATFGEQSAVASANQLYRHPEVQGQEPRRFVAGDDLYSLGLVLLEVALWVPLATIEGRGETTMSQAPLNMAKIKMAISGLPRLVGTIYQEVVEKCLNSGGGARQAVLSGLSAAEWNAERLRNQNSFYWDAVRKLEECSA